MDYEFVNACISGSLISVREILKEGVNIKRANGAGSTYLHMASVNGHLKIVELLIKAGANIKHANNYGETPLHWAARGGCLEIVELLIKAGANPNQADIRGNIPLYWAECNGRLDVVEFLKSYKNKISSLSLLCLRIIYQNQVNTNSIPSMLLEWNFHK